MIGVAKSFCLFVNNVAISQFFHMLSHNKDRERERKRERERERERERKRERVLEKVRGRGGDLSYRKPHFVDIFSPTSRKTERPEGDSNPGSPDYNPRALPS